MYAKRYNGQFIVRIEDTDQTRNVANGEKLQLDNLQWLGIIPDESPQQPNNYYGPYRQSEKISRYKKLCDLLLSKGIAYKAYDNSEELAKQRLQQKAQGQFSFRYNRNWLKISRDEQKKRDEAKQFVIRLKLQPNQTYQWHDLVRGLITINSNDIGDFVILRPNGFPTYNFAVVIDDYDMAISHVLRGEEHISNTPKQLAIYSAFGWKAPQFGHLTIITNMEGKKLSKRDFETKQLVSNYQASGYSNKALFNFLALLGWSHPGAKEIMAKDEIIAAFDPTRLSKSPTKFDHKKLAWFGKFYLQATPNNVLKKQLWFGSRNEKWIELFINTYKQSASSLEELQNAISIYDNTSKQIRPANLVTQTFKQELVKHPFTVAGINQALASTMALTNQKGKNLYMPIREITTYQRHGPELAKAIYLFGEKVIKMRLK